MRTPTRQEMRRAERHLRTQARQVAELPATVDLARSTAAGGKFNRPHSCFRNAIHAHAMFPEATYVEGWLTLHVSRRDQEAEHRVPHGWLDRNGKVVDPYLPSILEVARQRQVCVAVHYQAVSTWTKAALDEAWPEGTLADLPLDRTLAAHIDVDKAVSQDMFERIAARQQEHDRANTPTEEAP